MSIAAAVTTPAAPAVEPETWHEMLGRVARCGGRLVLTPQITPCGTVWFYVFELAADSGARAVSDFFVTDGITAIGSNG